MEHKYLKYKNKYLTTNIHKGGRIHIPASDFKETYPVYIINNPDNKNEFTLVGNIDVVNDTYELILKIQLTSVNRINKKLLKFFSTYDDYHNDIFMPSTFVIDNGNDKERIMVSIIKKSKDRKGTIYYIIQKSAIGIRYLVYVSMKTNHQSDSLGASVTVPTDEKLLNTFTTFLNENLMYKGLYDTEGVLHL